MLFFPYLPFMSSPNTSVSLSNIFLLLFKFLLKPIISTYTLVRLILVDAESFLLGLLPLSSFLSCSAAAEDTTSISWCRPVITSQDPINWRFCTCCRGEKKRSLRHIHFFLHFIKFWKCCGIEKKNFTHYTFFFTLPFFFMFYNNVYMFNNVCSLLLLSSTLPLHVLQ